MSNPAKKAVSFRGVSELLLRRNDGLFDTIAKIGTLKVEGKLRAVAVVRRRREQWEDRMGLSRYALWSPRRRRDNQGGRLQRRGNLEHLEQRWFLSADWQNPLNFADVDGSDGVYPVTPLDALLVINELSQRVVSRAETGELPVLAPEDGSPPPFLDVDGNGFVTPLDALLVINQLGRTEGVEGTSTVQGDPLDAQEMGYPPRAADSAIAGSRAADAIALTNDSRVNSHTRGEQRESRSAADANGNTWVTWSSFGQDGSSWGVYAQRYNATGSLIGSEFRVNTTTRHAQSDPSVAVRPDGRAVIVWQSLGEDGSGWGVYGQQFDSNGQPLGTQFLVNQTSLGHQWRPDVTFLGDGSFVVTWEGRGPGDTDGIFFRRFTTGDQPVGPETRINTQTSGSQSRPSIGAFGSANFAIAWEGKGLGDDRGVFMRRVVNDVPGNEVRLNGTTRGIQQSVSLAGNAAGQIVAAWQHAPEDNGTRGVRARQITSFGDLAGEEIVANLTIAGPQRGPSAALFGDGSFVLGWYGRGPQDRYGVFTRNFRPDGVGDTVEQLVNTTTRGLQAKPHIGLVRDNYLVTWHGRGQGDSFGVYSRLFEGPSRQNRAPELVSPIPDQAATVGQAFSLNVTPFFRDPDQDVLTFAASTVGGGPLPGWLQFNSQTGVLSGTPAVGDVAVTNITIRASDPLGLSVSDTFQLTVTAVDSPPTLVSPIPDQTATVAAPFSLSVGPFFNDDGPLNFTTSALPGWLTFSANTRQFTGTPAAGDVGFRDITVTATDALNQSVSDTFRLTVNPAVNRPPELVSPIPDQTAPTGLPFSLNLATFFRDPDPGDVLTLTVTQTNGNPLPAWLTFSATTGLLTGTPATSDVGSVNIRVRATDPGGLSASDDFNLSVVEQINRAPLIFDQSFRVPVNPANNFAVGTVLASDPDGDPLTYSITAGNPNNAFAISAQTGALTVVDASQLPAGQSSIVLTVSVAETANPSNSDTALVTIFRIDTPPVVAIRLRALDLSGNPVTSVVTGQEFDLVLLAEDLEASAGPPVRGGMFSVYADIGYSTDLMQVAGPIVHDPTYNAGTTGDVTQLGLIDDAGGTDGLTFLGPGEQEILRIRMRAGASPGTAFFFSDAPDNRVREITRFGDTATVPLNRIDFGRFSLQVTAMANGFRTGTDGSEESTTRSDAVDRVFAEIFG